jgi:hypothetical protein
MTNQVVQDSKEKTNPVNQIQGWKPSMKSTRQMRTQINTTQRKNKSKLPTKIKQRHYVKRIHNYEMTINNNKDDLIQKSCHLSQVS